MTNVHSKYLSFGNLIKTIHDKKFILYITSTQMMMDEWIQSASASTVTQPQTHQSIIILASIS